MLPAPALLPLAALALLGLPVPVVPAVALAPAGSQEATFSLDVPSEVVAVVTATCPGCDWGRRGHEAAALEVRLDGRYSQHLFLTRGSEVAEYRVALGRVGVGSHRLSLALDRERSGRAVSGASIEGVAFHPAPPGSAEEKLLAHAPVLVARPNTLGRFSDVPLVMWVEAEALRGGGSRLRYSVVFSNEDGGTPPDRLMATWGRLTDIEYVYGLELDPSGQVIAEQYQGPEHKLLPFAGRHEAGHPVLYVVTDNNMVSDRGRQTVRFAPAPVTFDLSNTSREAVMDAEPWTYAVSVREVRREGRVAQNARPGSDKLPDPRRFATLEACAATRDATIAFSIGVRGPDGSTGWHDSDAGLPRFRIGRRATEFPNGCFRGALALPAGTTAADIVGLRTRAFTRITGKNEPSLPKGAGSARLERVNTLFLLGPDDQPAASLFSWRGAAELAPEGPPFELSIQPGSVWVDKSPHQSRYATVNGVRLNYLDWGGNGAYLVLIHGLADSPHIFDDLAPLLVERFHVLAYARRGHGSSDAPAGDYAQGTLVEDLRQLLDRLGVARTSLVGWSMGGNEITAFAGLYPDRVEGLVYLEAGYDWSEPAFQKDFPPVAPDASALRSLDAYRTWYRETWFGNAPWTQGLEAYLRDIVRIDPDGRVQPLPSGPVFDALATSNANSHRDYRRVRTPALALYAGSFFPVTLTTPGPVRDWESRVMAPFRRASMERLQRELQNCVVREFPDTAHVSIGSLSPKALAVAIDEFLGAQRSGHQRRIH